MLPGKIATLLVIATVLSVIGALLVVWRYRAAMQALMKAPLAAALIELLIMRLVPLSLPGISGWREAVADAVLPFIGCHFAQWGDEQMSLF